jgi:hypothetical protein
LYALSSSTLSFFNEKINSNNPLNNQSEETQELKEGKCTDNEQDKSDNQEDSNRSKSFVYCLKVKSQYLCNDVNNPMIGVFTKLKRAVLAALSNMYGQHTYNSATQQWVFDTNGEMINFFRHGSKTYTIEKFYLNESNLSVLTDYPFIETYKFDKNGKYALQISRF